MRKIIDTFIEITITIVQSFTIVFSIPFFLLLYILAPLNVSLYILICAEKYRFDELGIHVRTRIRRRSRVLKWSEIMEVKQTFSPPFHKTCVVLNSGEQVTIDWADRNQLRAALKDHQIEFVELLGIR